MSEKEHECCKDLDPNCNQCSGNLRHPLDVLGNGQTGGVTGTGGSVGVPSGYHPNYAAGYPQPPVKKEEVNKPGWKTSEFWLATMAVLGTQLLNSGVLGDESSPGTKVVSAIVTFLAAAGYGASRTFLKGKFTKP